MKIFVSAIVLSVAFPALAFAQTSAPAAHEQHQGHMQHMEHKDSCDCCKEKNDCCEKAKAEGKKMACCEKHDGEKTGAAQGQQDHQGH